jgi:hypothetical protein
MEDNPQPDFPLGKISSADKKSGLYPLLIHEVEYF